MDYDDLLVRFFGTAAIDTLEPEQLAKGVDLVRLQFGLERDPESRNAIQAAGPTGPRDHTSIRLGFFYYYGSSVPG